MPLHQEGHSRLPQPAGRATSHSRVQVGPGHAALGDIDLLTAYMPVLACMGPWYVCVWPGYWLRYC